MNTLKRFRSDGDEIFSDNLRKAYKDTLAPSTKFAFILRTFHSNYFNMEQNQSLSQIDLSKKIKFATIEMLNKEYLSDIVLYQESEEELKMFFRNLIGTEAYNAIAGADQMDIEVNNQDTSATQEKTDFRYKAISLLNLGLSRKTVCDTLKIKLNQLKYYITLASKGKLDLLPRQQSFGQAWYDELSLYFSCPLRRHTSLHDIKKHLCAKLNHPQDKISLTTISYMIKKIGYSYKRSRAGVIQRNIPRIIESRYKKSLDYLALLKHNNNFIYIDETGFNRGIIPIYGYSKIGEPLTYSRKSLSANYTVICAITQKKILGYQIFKGGVTAECFGAFLIALLNDCPEIKENLDKWIFYMDNAAIHRAKILEPFLKHLRIFYAPAYSPFLNPIEEFFGLWKHYFRKELLSDEQDYLKMISRALKHITQEDISKFYDHSLTFLHASYSKKNIE